MTRSFLCVLLLGCLSVLVPSQAQAVVVILGEKDFTDGDFLTVPIFDLSSAGESAPFDAFIGNDGGATAGSDFIASWTFNFVAPVSIGSADVQLGLFDHDSQAGGPQVATFTLDGVDLTAELNALLDAVGGQQLEYNIYQLILPASAIAELADGSATFQLTLSPPGFSASGQTSNNNGAGIDFSILTVEAGGNNGGGGAVPEPASLAMLAVAAGFGLRRRRGLAA